MPKTLTGTLRIMPLIDTGPFGAKIVGRTIEVVDGEWIEDGSKDE